MGIGEALKGLETGHKALDALTAWRKKARGDARALAGEVRENYRFIDMMHSDGVALDQVIAQISLDEFKRLSREGYNFDALRRAKIPNDDSIAKTELRSFRGKSTSYLVENIYDKLADLKAKYPLLRDSDQYDWPRGVANIRRRLLLLINHLEV
jgi:hypothetical protein